MEPGDNTVTTVVVNNDEKRREDVISRPSMGKSNETGFPDKRPSRVSIFKGGSKWNIVLLKMISGINSDLDLEHGSYI